MHQLRLLWRRQFEKSNDSCQSKTAFDRGSLVTSWAQPSEHRLQRTVKRGNTPARSSTGYASLTFASACNRANSASVSSITRPPTCTRTASELRLTACVPAGIVHLLPAALVAAHSSKRYRSAIATDLFPAPDFSSHTIRRLLAWCLGSARSDCALRPSSAKAITNAPETAAVGVSGRRPDPGVP